MYPPRMNGTAGQSPSTEATTSQGAWSAASPNISRAQRTASSLLSSGVFVQLQCTALAPKKKMARTWRGGPWRGDTSKARVVVRTSGSAMAQCAPFHQRAANSTTTLMTLPILCAATSVPRGPASLGSSERPARAGGGTASTTRRALNLAPSLVATVAPSVAEWEHSTTSAPSLISTPLSTRDAASLRDSVPLPWATRCVWASSRRTSTPPSSATTVRKRSMEIWEASAQNTLCTVAAISPLAVELFGAPSSLSHAITDEESSLSAPLASHGRPIGIALAMRLTRRVRSAYWIKSQAGSPRSVVNNVVVVVVVSLPNARLSHPESPPALRTPTRIPEVCCSMTSSPCSRNRRCTFFCLGHTQQAPTSTGSSSGRHEVSVRPPARSRASTMTTSDGSRESRSLEAHESPARPAPTMTTL
mmetsp:Transcript_2612/g.6550  ORF Transcript_2612/g.6550 Transcript_2612/m.6550 type:complete len:418 (-) Transcript_2612:23-1276(-)